jgi:hypothetical protein
MGFFIFFRVEENEPKEDARVPRPLRGFPAHRRGERSARELARLRQGYGGLKQSARFIPSAPSMLGAGQRETRKPKTEKPFSTLSRELFCTPF